MFFRETALHKKLQEEAREVTEIFASVMNQSVRLVSQNTDDMSSEIGISKAEGTQDIANSYESFGYRENRIGIILFNNRV